MRVYVWESGLCEGVCVWESGLCEGVCGRVGQWSV